LRLLGEQRLNRHAAKVSNAWSIELCYREKLSAKLRNHPRRLKLRETQTSFR